MRYAGTGSVTVPVELEVDAEERTMRSETPHSGKERSTVYRKRAREDESLPSANGESGRLAGRGIVAEEREPEGAERVAREADGGSGVGVDRDERLYGSKR